MTGRALIGLLGALLTLSAVPAHAGPEQTAAVVKVTYPGQGVEVWRHSGKVDDLTGTPRSFKRFVAHRLERLFGLTGRRPACARSPLVVVHRYHGDGFASFGEGIYRACPAGGYAGIYVRTSAGWRAPLAGQEALFCSDLQWYAVPRFVAGPTCQTEDFGLADYGLGKQPRVSTRAVARRLVAAAAAFPIVPARELATREVIDRVTALVDHGAYLSVSDCLVAGDGQPASAFLGDAPYGCVLEVHHRSRVTDHVLRMYPGVDDTISVGALVPAR